MENFLSPNSSGDLRSDAHHSQIIGGDAEEDHTQIIGGIQSNYWGGYILPGFGTPDANGLIFMVTLYIMLIKLGKIIIVVDKIVNNYMTLL